MPPKHTIYSKKKTKKKQINGRLNKKRTRKTKIMRKFQTETDQGLQTKSTEKRDYFKT